MRSIKFFSLGFFGLFFASIFVIFFYVRAGEYEFYHLLSSLAITTPFLLYVFFRVSLIRGGGVSVPVKGVLTNLSPIAIVLILGLVLVGLFLTDLDTLKLTRETQRHDSILRRLLNMHVVLAFFVVLYAYSRERMQVQHRILILLAIALSLVIALLEGRRTSIILPLALLALFDYQSRSHRRDGGYRILGFAFVIVAVFVLITFVRAGASTDIEFVTKALLSRLFNPGFILLEVVSQGDYSFNFETGFKSLERVAYSIGGGDYVSNTNHFGRYYGLLRPDNYFVGINPGVIVELFMSYGLASPIFFMVLFEVIVYVMRLYRSLLYGSDFFVAVLMLHGLQMEVPYVIGLLSKLITIAFFLKFLSTLFPKKEVVNI